MWGQSEPEEDAGDDEHALKGVGGMDEKRLQAAALAYKPELDMAPRLVAGGRGKLAERIIAAARENDVPVQEDTALVELLLQLDLGQEIPPELYQVVAEVLAFVYRLEKAERP